ncbi:MAG TPA: hypothetical protein DCQ06_07195 [Myxococcales bacterium]|nr:hypothetical protein [Myxococcales bacterium]
MSLTIRLAILKDGAKSGAASIDPELWQDDLGAIFSAAESPLMMKWSLSAVGGVVELAGEIEGALRFDCARCAEQQQLSVSLPVAHHWVPAGQLSVDIDEELTDFDRDPDVSEHDGDALHLEPIVRESLLVELPYAPRCADGLGGPCPDWTDTAATMGVQTEAPEVEPDHPFAALASMKLPGSKQT